jgi:hypothetical protein
LLGLIIAADARLLPLVACCQTLPKPCPQTFQFNPLGCTLAMSTGVNAYQLTCADRCSRRTDEEEDDAMHTIEIQEYARQLLEAHGAKAIAEAAQKAAASEKRGDKEQAETWRRVEAALMLMHGPRQT